MSDAPCKCHQNFAYVTPTHSGHCCFWPATQTCHPEEVAEWRYARAFIKEARNV